MIFFSVSRCVEAPCQNFQKGHSDVGARHTRVYEGEDLDPSRLGSGVRVTGPNPHTGLGLEESKRVFQRTQS
jgi:hypothetical protein